MRSVPSPPANDSCARRRRRRPGRRAGSTVRRKAAEARRRRKARRELRTAQGQAGRASPHRAAQVSARAKAAPSEQPAREEAAPASSAGAAEDCGRPRKAAAAEAADVEEGRDRRRLRPRQGRPRQRTAAAKKAAAGTPRGTAVRRSETAARSTRRSRPGSAPQNRRPPREPKAEAAAADAEARASGAAAADDVRRDGVRAVAVRGPAGAAAGRRPGLVRAGGDEGEHQAVRRCTRPVARSWTATAYRCAVSEDAVAITADPTQTEPVAQQLASILAPKLPVRRTAKLLADADRQGPLRAARAPGQPADLERRSRPSSRPATPRSTRQNQGLAEGAEAPLLAGLYTEADPIRSHPNGTIAANVVGVVGAEGKGLAGLEYGLNDKLSGQDGKAMYEVDAKGNKIPNANHTVEEPKPGVTAQLTLDARPAVVRGEADRAGGQAVQGRVRHGGHDGRQVRRDPGDGRTTRPSTRTSRSRPGDAEEPRAGAGLRAGQRAEGGHDGRARRRRPDRPEHQAQGARQHRGAAADDQGPLRPRHAEPDHRRRDREVVERRHHHGRRSRCGSRSS